MRPPQELQEFHELLSCTTPLRPGEIVQQEADNEEDEVPSDEEFPSDDEGSDDELALPQGAAQDQRALRIQRRAAGGRQSLMQASTATVDVPDKSKVVTGPSVADSKAKGATAKAKGPAAQTRALTDVTNYQVCLLDLFA